MAHRLVNLAYLATLVGLAWQFNEYRIFLIGTSWIHYMKYIYTYYFRNLTASEYDAFKEEVLLFKTISIAQIAYHYFMPIITGDAAPNYLSIALIVFGYAVSILATKALGVDRTYFGVELGFYEPKWITDFPYGYIPHPMIVGQCAALTGAYLFTPFRTTWPWLIPMHVVFYFTHCVQEHYDVHKDKPKNQKKHVYYEEKSS